MLKLAFYKNNLIIKICENHNNFNHTCTENSFHFDSISQLIKPLKLLILYLVDPYSLHTVYIKCNKHFNLKMILSAELEELLTKHSNQSDERTYRFIYEIHNYINHTFIYVINNIQL